MRTIDLMKMALLKWAVELDADEVIEAAIDACAYDVNLSMNARAKAVRILRRAMFHLEFRFGGVHISSIPESGLARYLRGLE